MEAQELLAMAHHEAPRAAVRILGWGSLGAIVLAFLWYHPASPIALWRPDVAMGNRRPHAAAVAYDAVGRSHPNRSVRVEALRRSALVWAIDLGRPEEALARYEQLLQQPMAPTERAPVLAHLGELLADGNQFAEAAQRLREAHDLDPKAIEAPDRLVKSARASNAAGDDDAADLTWRRLADRHPVYAARAHLGRANLRLQRGDAVGALGMYESALNAAFDPAVAAAAQLGIATCLERLGDLESALAQLDEADLPGDIRAQRVSSIRARDRLAQ